MLRCIPENKPCVSVLMGMRRKEECRSAQQYAESKKVAEKVLFAGANHGVLGKNVLFYHADYVSPGWNLRRVAKIGDHIFYAG